MAWNSPIAPARVLRVVELAAMPTGASALDVGCGDGDFLAELANVGLSVTGIDRDEKAIALAAKLVPAADVRAEDATVADLPKADLVSCIGSTHIFGSGLDALTGCCRALAGQVKPGGALLLGEGYHDKSLPAEYATFLGTPTGIERTHHQNVLDAEAASGMRCEHAITATRDEWDEFEWSFFRQFGRQDWRDAWLAWGRDVMGFGLYLLRPRS